MMAMTTGRPMAARRGAANSTSWCDFVVGRGVLKALKRAGALAAWLALTEGVAHARQRRTESPPPGVRRLSFRC
jgi:hypothetical protein